jgi:hypothetical protein
VARKGGWKEGQMIPKVLAFLVVRFWTATRAAWIVCNDGLGAPLHHATYRFRFTKNPSRPHLKNAGPQRNWVVCPDCEHIQHPPGSYLVPGTPKVPKLEVGMRKVFQTEVPETVRVKARALFTQTR